MPFARNIRTSASSVIAFPVLRTRDIITDRWRWSKTSTILALSEVLLQRSFTSRVDECFYNRWVIGHSNAANGRK
jgi:hypothetical protein